MSHVAGAGLGWLGWAGLGWAGLDTAIHTLPTRRRGDNQQTSGLSGAALVSRVPRPHYLHTIYTLSTHYLHTGQWPGDGKSVICVAA